MQYLYINVIFLFYIVLLFGMLVAVWGYESSFKDLIGFTNFIISGDFINTSFLLPLILVVFYILNFTFLRLPLALKFGISIKDYCKSLILYNAINGYMMFSLIKEELKVIFGAKVQFDVTDKNRYHIHKSSIIQIIKEMKYGALFNIVLIIGLLRNLAFLIFNFIWLIPLLISPLIIYLMQKDESVNG